MDGIFGSGTEIAVKAFQRVNGLSADGIAGENTFAKLFG
ncbi:peptidoglycan-binding protein [Peribacillus frigoritolerans]